MGGAEVDGDAGRGVEPSDLSGGNEGGGTVDWARRRVAAGSGKVEGKDYVFIFEK